MEIKKVLLIAILGIGGIWTFYFVFKKWQKILSFLRDVKLEMKKVSWSAKKELIGSTWIVIVSVMLISFFIGVVDFIISHAVNLVIR